MPQPAIYVVVCQNDKPHWRWGVDTRGPLVHEQYVNTATLENAQQRCAELEGYGACRIGRVVFEDEPGFNNTTTGA